ncbi:MULTISPECIES: ABC transporter permease [Kitasatospora]|uniref:ABC-2 type transport system permease protein n=2 Tax=Kitasatospora TaxID=2063 RepID=A0ABT1ISI8_9ACTN|nr:ABC transporter permease [Kitasatospora paracochleata]MCP2307949.1 ABC-2 type transport system permease protein [Kitasatospora paracochleata]
MTTTSAPSRPAAAPEQPEQERVSAFGGLSRVMLLGFVRDRGALFFTLIMPLMFLLLFGALYKSGGTPHVKIAEVGQVQLLDTAEAALQGQPNNPLAALEITKYTDESAALEKVKKGELDGLVEQGTDGRVVVRYSQGDQVKASTVQGIMNGLVQAANQQAAGTKPPFSMDLGQVEDKALKPIQYLTPGLLGYAVAMGAVYGASFTLVSWRKKRVLRRLRLTPVSTGTIVAARVGVSVLVALAQTGLFLAVATMPFFGLKLTGNWWLVLPLVVCATIAFMSIGLVTGAVAKSEEAANGINQMLILPMSFLGGAFIPLDFAPGWLQTVSHALPLRYLIVSAKSVLSQGGGLMDVLPSMGGLLAFAAVMALIASRFFNWDDA